MAKLEFATGKVDKNAHCDKHDTALMVTAASGSQNHVTIFSSLLEHRANVRLSDNNGQTALDLATAGGHQEIVAMLTPAANFRGQINIYGDRARVYGNTLNQTND